MTDIRYIFKGSLQLESGRGVVRVEDSWTGETRVLKRAPLPFALREARALLDVPRGCAPALEDLIWRSDGRLDIVLEHQPGATLAEVAHRSSRIRSAPSGTSGPRSSIPAARIAGGLCGCLADVHRAGWIHSDLKPENVIVIGERGAEQLRLLDFGFSIYRFGDPAEWARGGTPPYLAPELANGWTVDTRADQYSLGVILRKLHPELPRNPRWKGFLEKLMAAHASNRYADIVEVRDAIPRMRGDAVRERAAPQFGAGPMVGRDSFLQSVLDRIKRKPGVRIVVQARPGTGLSRFLREVVLAAAGSGCPPVRIVDLPMEELRRRSGSVIDCLASTRRHPESIVWGIGDPSPGLHWAGVPGIISAIRSHRSWERIVLPPLGSESIQDITAASLGARDPASDALGRRLWEQTEGNLHRAAEGFRHIVERCGQEEGLDWRVSQAALPALAWEPRAFSPRPQLVPGPLVGPLSLASRAGRSFPRALGTRLFEEFDRRGNLDELVDHGYLEEQGSRRLRFATRRLWDAASGEAFRRADEADRWLCHGAEPDVSVAEEILHFCGLARRFGEVERETAWRANALTHADRHRMQGDVRRLLAYPDPEPVVWTEEFVLRQIDGLSGSIPSLSSAALNRETLLQIAGANLKGANRELSVRLLELAAAGNDRQAKFGALLFLADDAANQPGSNAFESYIERMRALEDGLDDHSRGVIQFLEAFRAKCLGSSVEAQERAEGAARLLRGSGSLYEALTLQILAVQRYGQEPQRGIATMRAALQAADDPELAAQIRTNLALMYGQTGKLPLAARCADEGIQEAPDTLSPGRLFSLRSKRAWTWADLDRIEEAKREALALLRLSHASIAPRRRVTVRLLIGYCHLHDGRGTEAIREIHQSWVEARDQVQVGMRWDCLRYLTDALLDLEAWDLVVEYLAGVSAPPATEDPFIITTAARAKALVLQQGDHLEEARKVLDQHIDVARKIPDRVAAARYLHHLGLVLLASDREPTRRHRAAAAADTLFEESLETLAKPGNGYYRGRTILARGLALLQLDRSKALQELNQAVALARRLRCPGLLARALNARAEARLSKR